MENQLLRYAATSYVADNPRQFTLSMRSSQLTADRRLRIRYPFETADTLGTHAGHCQEATLHPQGLRIHD